MRETSLDVGLMRSVENRISFSAELASLMWFHDEKEAKAMYAGAVGDFKQLLMQFDSQMNSLDMPVEDDSSMSFLFGGMGRSPGRNYCRNSPGGSRQRVWRSCISIGPRPAPASMW